MTNLQNEIQAQQRELEKQNNAKVDEIQQKSMGKNLLKAQDMKPDDYVKRASLHVNVFSPEEKGKILSYSQTELKAETHEKKKSYKKRVQKVRPEDMKKIGYELNLRLRARRLTFEDLDKVIILNISF